jgi:Glycosyltransferase family 87
VSTVLAKRSFLLGRGAVAVSAACLGIGLFAGSWTLLHHGFLARHQIIDTPVYQDYGRAMTDGQAPYRDFRPEYPPAALPAFVLPEVGHPSENAYRHRFGWEMLVCGIAMVALMAVALWYLEAGPIRYFGGLAFAGLAPLALGSVVLTRFDLWPAAITAGAMAALVAGRLRVGAALVGVGFAAKLYPGLLLPLGLAYAWRLRGRREAFVCGAVFLAVVAVLFVPFLVLAPSGLADSVTHQGTRPLQLESLGSALLLGAHHLFGLALVMSSSNGSQNLSGAGPDTLAVVESVLQGLAVIAIWVWFAHGPVSRERLVRASAAAVCAFIAFSKVLSPQFMIWLIPLVPLVRGRRGLLASGLFGAALLLTQGWFPSRYWELALRFAATPSWLVFARDLVLVALLVALTVPGSSDADADRLAGGRPPVLGAADEDALDADVALRGPEADEEPGAHALDRKVALDADHRVVRAGHASVRDCRRASALHAGV